MSKERDRASSPADEQRTTRLPRPSDRARPQPPGNDTDRWPAAPEDPRRPTPDSGWPAAPDNPWPSGRTPPPNRETTVLRRPSGQAPGASNIPGARRTTGRPAGADGPTRDTSRAAPEAPDGHRRDPDRGAPRPTGRRRSALPPYAQPPEAYARTGPRLGGDPPVSPDLDAREAAGAYDPRGLSHKPRKLTVTRVAALRSRELTHRGLLKFHGAVSADGADLSGLAHLTYAQMGNYAVDAALAVALANTLFFAAATAESTGKVLLYLLLTVAPFAVVAPLIGPLLDKLQHGRRFALAASSFGRAALAITMAVKFESWVIYPCALGMLVLSKSFGVLKAALTPRVLPDAITLVKTNSRLSVFGLVAGGIAGAVAAGIAAIFGSAGALGFTAACGIVGGWLCLRIPAWVESTEGEVPVHHSQQLERTDPTVRRRGLPRVVAGALWINGTIRVETGFLALFIAFVVKTEYEPSSALAASGATATPGDSGGWTQLLLLGAVGAAAGLGGFLGNALGARLPLRAPETVALVCLCCVIASVIAAFLMPGIIAACGVGLVGSTGSALAKVCLDSSIQQSLPEASRASAFGRSESVLQLSWVFGGVVGLLIGGIWGLSGDTVYMTGFGIVALLLMLGAAQCVAIRLERTLIPRIRKPRPASAGAAGTPRTGWPAPATTAARQQTDTRRAARPPRATTSERRPGSQPDTSTRGGSKRRTRKVN